jgi:hypothetical protein
LEEPQEKRELFHRLGGADAADDLAGEILKVTRGRDFVPFERQEAAQRFEVIFVFAHVTFT